MHGHSELKRLADSRRFDARTDAAPEGRVEQNYVYRRVERVGGELLEVDDDRVGGQRHSDFLAHALHSGHSEDGVFQVVVANLFDLLGEPDRSLRRPDAVRVEAEVVVAVERVGERVVALQFVLRREDAALQFVRAESVALSQIARVRDQLLDGSHFARAVFRVRVAEEEIRSERHAIPQTTAEDVTYGNAPLLPQNVEAGEFQRRQNLRAVVVERGRRVGDQKPHFFQLRRIVADQIAFHRAEDGFCRFAAAAHLAETDQTFIGFNFNDGADEASPVAAVRVTERRFQRHSNGSGSNISDLHTISAGLWYTDLADCYGSARIAP